MPVPSNNRGNANRQDEVRLKRLTNLGVLSVTCDDGQRTLVVSGELDLSSSWLLDHPLLQIGADGAKSFTLDLSKLTFIDSAGVRAILAARELCKARDCEFMVIPGSAQVQRVFEVSGLVDQLPFTNRGADLVTES